MRTFLLNLILALASLPVWAGPPITGRYCEMQQMALDRARADVDSYMNLDVPTDILNASQAAQARLDGCMNPNPAACELSCVNLGRSDWDNVACTTKWNNCKAECQVSCESLLAQAGPHTDACEMKARDCASQVPASRTQVTGAAAAATAAGEAALNPNLESLIRQCETRADLALEICSREEGTTRDAITTASQNAQSSISSAGSAQSCQQLNSFTQEAQSLINSFQSACGSPSSACATSCASAQNALDEEKRRRGGNPNEILRAETTRWNTARTRCADAGQKVSAMQSQAQALRAETERSARCSNDTSTAGTTNGLSLPTGGGTTAASPVPTSADCRANPSAPGCAAALPQDCTNPQFAATNAVCRGLRGDTVSRGADGTAPTMLPAADRAADPGLTSNPGLFGTPDIPAVPGVYDSTYGSNPTIGGGGGGGGHRGSGGGLGGGGTDPRARSHSKSNFDTNIIGGGGRPSGPGGSPGALKGGGDSGGGGFYGGGRRPAARGGSSSENVDLTRFLPTRERSGGRFQSDVTGPDGITGPYSNIWKKVNNRYSAEGRRLMP